MQYLYIICFCIRSQCFPLQVTGWPLELIAYAYLAVSPPSMSGKFEEVRNVLYRYDQLAHSLNT